MKQARILPLLGPALVLYLVADAASSASGLDATGLLVAVVAAICSLAPLGMRRRTDDPGARRVGLLGLSVGSALLPGVIASEPPFAVDVAGAIGFVFVGALSIDLALTVPDRPRALDRGGYVRVLPTMVALAVLAIGLLGVAPAVPFRGGVLVVPHAWSKAPEVFALAALLVTIALRLARRRMGSSPEALASNSWVTLGLVLATAALASSVLTVRLGFLVRGDVAARALIVAFAVTSLAGHVAMIDARRRLHAGPMTRAFSTATLALAVVVPPLALVHELLPRDPGASMLVIAAVLLGAEGVRRTLDPLVERLLAPFGGRLLRSIGEIEERLATAATLEDLARAVLVPLRRASGAHDAAPLLFAHAPAREARIDAAGEPHVRAQPMPSALIERLQDRPGEVIVRAALEATVVRRPAERPLTDALVALDALLVVPLTFDAEVEGALVVPRGRRRSTPTLEEIAALERFGTRISGLLRLVMAEERARERVTEHEIARKRLDDRIEALDSELERLRVDALVWKAGRASAETMPPLVAYGPRMRALVARIAEVAPLEAPTLIVGENGSSLEPLARRLHVESGRKRGPFVVAPVSRVARERVRSALFGEAGDEPSPGWLRLATGGTLVVLDVPALPLDVQRELAEVIATREARPVGGAGAHPVDVRLVATSRVAIEPLVLSGTVDPELARWLRGIELVVPPLRERREDLSSLALLAIDRACRVLGREPVGIDQEALDVLLAHDFPGNVRELEHVMESAVARARGPKIQVADLPQLARGEDTAAQNPLDGTFSELERRALLHALDRAHNNKSEAARLLGLARTTFLDKLRRHGLTGEATEPAREGAEADESEPVRH